jgi:AraC-like DNA-binding protein
MRDLDRQKTDQYIRERGIGNTSALAFGHLDDSGDVRYDWHEHAYHQLLYSFRGAGQVEAGNARYFLPPQRAAWISAGTRHRTTLVNCSGTSVFFHPRLIRWKVEPIRVIAAPPLLQEMVKGSARWAPHSDASDPLRKSYFRTLALLCRNWLEQDLPFWLPETDDPQLARAIEYTLHNLQTASAEKASTAAAMSSRSFRRHFSAKLGTSWQDYLLKARLLRAMDLLSLSGARITDVANEVGFDSPSSFSKAFSEFVEETPSQYRSRCRRESP